MVVTNYTNIKRKASGGIVSSLMLYCCQKEKGGSEMAKRISRSIDSARSDLLAIEELFVVKGEGDSDNYVAWLCDEIPDCCPFCLGKKFKNHNLFSHTYRDYIREDNVPRIINLKYEFYKYRCLNHDCGRIFAKEIPFATVRDNVTLRLENFIADSVIRGSSYEQISESFGSVLTRQAIHLRLQQTCRLPPITYLQR